MSTITTDPDTLIETWEVGELQTMLEDDATVACTPLSHGKPVLPTKHVPYAKKMVWEWYLVVDTYVDGCLVVAKIEHHFSLTAMPSKAGDTIELVLLASDLEHNHGN
ncbi:hypothetical protein LCGC14_2611910 [marine sediment metagenome]|uniref:Uncharacterized protein n=1 Tax=marine sediment metagenome TaxID=412755 RepID=A0A0F9ATA2_9ZZZZ